MNSDVHYKITKIDKCENELNCDFKNLFKGISGAAASTLAIASCGIIAAASIIECRTDIIKAYSGSLASFIGMGCLFAVRNSIDTSIDAWKSFKLHKKELYKLISETEQNLESNLDCEVLER